MLSTAAAEQAHRVLVELLHAGSAGERLAAERQDSARTLFEKHCEQGITPPQTHMQAGMWHSRWPFGWLSAAHMDLVSSPSGIAVKREESANAERSLIRNSKPGGERHARSQRTLTLLAVVYWDTVIVDDHSGAQALQHQNVNATGTVLPAAFNLVLV